jgi:alkylhydroperoxidase family enzyme
MPPSVRETVTQRLRARNALAGSPEQLRELRALVPQQPPAHPRIAPGTREDIGIVNHAITTLLARVAGARTLNVMTTMARDRGLFRSWLLFAGRLMPGGRLPRADTELVILRVAVNCHSAYEWHQHVAIGLSSGLSPEQIAAVAQEAPRGPFSARQQTLLRVTDELHVDRTLADQTWSSMTEHLERRELIEMLVLVGHYEMLAMALNAMRVQVEH